MARVAAVFDDLLLGSNVLGRLRAAGHDATLVAPSSRVAEDAEVVVIDLASTGFDGLAVPVPARARRLGLYSHVDAGARERALAAGFDLVVPRSRFAREGEALVERLLA